MLGLRNFLAKIADGAVSSTLAAWSVRRRAIAEIGKHYMADFSLVVAEGVQASTCIKQAIADTEYGKFLFDTRDRMIGWQIATHGCWERGESELVKSLLQPGDVVIDAGANLGWFSVLFGKAVASGSTGAVHSFEPVPEVFDLLQRNIALNGLENVVTCHQFALSETAEEKVIHVNDSNLGDNRIQADPSKPMESPGKSVRIVCKRLDDALLNSPINDRPIKLMKIDCQGWEVSVLLGAPKTLQRTELLLVEFEPDLLIDAGVSINDYANSIKPYFSSFAKVPKQPVAKLQYSPIAELDALLAVPLAKNDNYNILFRK